MLGDPMEGRCCYGVEGVLGLDKKIYFAPHNATHVLCVDPGQGSVHLVGTALRNRGISGLFQGSGVRARNGRIFFAPCNFHSVLCIHASGDTQLFALEPHPERDEYISGGVLAKNGHIFFPPERGLPIVHVDPEALVIARPGRVGV